MNIKEFLRAKLVPIIGLYVGLFWAIFLLRYVLQPILGFNYEYLQPDVLIPFLHNYLVESLRSTLLFFRHLNNALSDTVDNVLNMGFRFCLITVVVLVDQIYTLNLLNIFRAIFQVVSTCIQWVGPGKIFTFQMLGIIIWMMGVETTVNIFWVIMIVSYWMIRDNVIFVSGLQDLLAAFFNEIWDEFLIGFVQ